jgi:hypothetical protein
MWSGGEDDLRSCLLRTYPTDLSDAEFRHIEPHLPAATVELGAGSSSTPLSPVGRCWLPREGQEVVGRGGLELERRGRAYKPQKPLPEKVAEIWAEELAKEDIKVNWQRLMPPRGFRVLPRRDGLWRGLSPGWDNTAG